MGTTSLGFSYPEGSDVPDGAAQIQALAEGIDAYLAALGGGGWPPVVTNSFAAASVVNVDDCFVGGGHYKGLIEITGRSGTENIGSMRMRSGGVDDSTSGHYAYGSFYHDTGNALNLWTSQSAVALENLWYSGTDTNHPVIVEFEINGANQSRYTVVRGQSSYRQTDPLLVEVYFHGTHMVASPFDGFSFYPGAGTIDGQYTIWECPRS